MRKNEQRCICGLVGVMGPLYLPPTISMFPACHCRTTPASIWEYYVSVVRPDTGLIANPAASVPV